VSGRDTSRRPKVGNKKTGETQAVKANCPRQAWGEGKSIFSPWHYLSRLSPATLPTFKPSGLGSKRPPIALVASRVPHSQLSYRRAVGHPQIGRIDFMVDKLIKLIIIYN